MRFHLRSIPLALLTFFVLACSAARIFAAAGDLYVTDSATNAILVYSPDGTRSVFAGGLNNPQGLAFDSAGNLYVADMGSGDIFKFSIDGTAKAFATGLSAPAGLVVNYVDNIVVAEYGGNRVDKITKSGVKSVLLSLGAPYGVGFDESTVFVTNHASTVEVNSTGQSSTMSTGDNSRCVSIDSADNIFLSSDSGVLFKIDTNGSKTIFDSNLIAPSGMAFDGGSDDGHLCLADRGGYIYKYTSAGRITFASGGSPNFLAFEPKLAGRLLNISTRGRVLTGDNVLIGGFIITGTTPKRVIVRAIGPELTGYHVSGVLADPILDLHYPDGSVVTNDNWKSTQAAEIQSTNLAPKNDFESAIVATLAPGSYTAVVRGKGTATGVALVEVYDLDPAGAEQLGNISTRGFVDVGDNVLIAGFIVGSQENASGKVLVRAIGPSISQYVSHPLQDPTLELHDANGVLLKSNDNWADTHRAAIQRTGLAPADARESAILANLTAGSYTAIVRGKNNATGVALVEVYHMK